MRKLVLAFALLVGMVSAASAQCNGIFPSGYVCGSANGGVPGPTPATSFGIAAGTFPSPQGRLTLASGFPYMNRTLTCGAGCFGVSNASSILYTPGDGGCLVPLWNGTVFVPTCCPEISNVLANSSVGSAGPFAAVSNAVYDLYISTGCILSRSDYWQQLGTVTNTNASPAVFTQAGNGMLNSTPVRLNCIGGGSLSPGFTPNTQYYVVAANTGAGTFQLAATIAGAAINAAGASTCVTSQQATEGAGNNLNNTVAPARGTANGQTRVNGLFTNTLAITNGPGAGFGTYVGTVYTNTSGGVDYIFGGLGANGGIAGSLGVYNLFNKHQQTTQVIDTNTYTYSSATYRLAGSGTSLNTIDWIVGQREEGFCAAYEQKAVTAATAGSTGKFAIGFDVLPPQVDTPPFIVYADGNTAHTGAGATIQCHNDLQLGRHEIQAIEATDGSAVTFGGQDGGIGGALGLSITN